MVRMNSITIMSTSIGILLMLFVSLFKITMTRVKLKLRKLWKILKTLLGMRKLKIQEKIARIQIIQAMKMRLYQATKKDSQRIRKEVWKGENPGRIQQKREESRKSYCLRVKILRKNDLSDSTHYTYIIYFVIA